MLSLQKSPDPDSSDHFGLLNMSTTLDNLLEIAVIAIHIHYFSQLPFNKVDFVSADLAVAATDLAIAWTFSDHALSQATASPPAVPVAPI
ncbi:hypothetical protein C8J56DRAFT_1040015 [Mycena floridula]|nr:hypothetical protein C8J56DRAFT_1040015 [Mycena floridula]